MSILLVTTVRREAFRVFAGPDASHFMAADELKNILMNFGEKMSEVTAHDDPTTALFMLHRFDVDWYRFDAIIGMVVQEEVEEMMAEANIKPDSEVDFHEFITTILGK